MQCARGGHKGHFTAPRQRKQPCRGMNVIKVTRDYASVFYVNTRQHLYERDNNNNNVTRVRFSRRARNRTIIIFIRFARARHYYVQMIVFRTDRILRTYYTIIITLASGSLSAFTVHAISSAIRVQQ